MSQFGLLLKGSALRSLEAIVAIVAGFITLPLMNTYLGIELYGLWVLIGSFIAMMYLFDMGFASAVTQKLASYLSQKDHTKANEIISTALSIYTILALLIALVVLIIAVGYQPDLKGVISHEEFEWVVILTGVAIAIEFPAKAFAGLAQAHFRHDLVALYRIIFKILSTTALIVLLLMGYKILAIALMSLIFSVLSTISFIVVGRHVYKEMSLSLQYINRRAFKELFGYSIWAFFIDLNHLIKSRIDIFFIGAYISLSAVTTYYVAIRLVDYATQLLHKMLSITLPTLTGHIASGNMTAFREDFLLFNRINTYAYTLSLIMFVVFGKSIFFYWLGSDFDYEAAFVVLMIIALGRISIVAMDGYTTSLYANSKHRLLVLSGMAETVLTILMLYIFLARLNYGVFYVALAVTVPILLLRFLLLPWLCQKQLRLPRYRQLVWLSYRPTMLLLICVAIQWVYGTDVILVSYQKLVEVSSLALVCAIFLILEIQSREKVLITKIFKKTFSIFIRKPYGAK